MANRNCKNCKHYTDNQDNYFGNVEYYIQYCSKHKFEIRRVNFNEVEIKGFICDDYEQTESNIKEQSLKQKINFRKTIIDDLY